MLLQGTFLTSPIGAAGAMSAVAADLRGGVIFTVGIGVAAVATYSDVSGLWSLSNTCAVINPSYYNDVFINIILESFSERKFMLSIITDKNLA